MVSNPCLNGVYYHVPIPFFELDGTLRDNFVEMVTIVDGPFKWEDGRNDWYTCKGKYNEIDLFPDQLFHTEFEAIQEMEKRLDSLARMVEREAKIVDAKRQQLNLKVKIR